MAKILATKRLSLRPVEGLDEALLGFWKRADDYLELVSDRELKKYHSRHMISLNKGSVPIGIVYTFSYNEADGYMFLNIYLVDKYRRRGYGAEACILLICELFDRLSLHKIYCDAFSSNEQSVAMMRSAGLTQEGCLKGHRLYRGRRYDVVRFAVHQENLGVLRGLLQKFKSR